MAADILARIEAVAFWVRGLRSWRRALLGFAAGAASALAQAPFDIWPILFVTLPLLVWMIDGANPRRSLRSAAFAGWVFGFGYFLAGLYWIGVAFTVDADTFAWMIPFVAVILPGGLALFWGAAAALAGIFWRPGVQRIALFAAVLSGFEFARGHVLTGFPWNLFGFALSGSDAAIQFASIAGIYGLSLLVFFAAASFAAFADAASRLWLRLAAPAAGLAIVAGLYVFGIVRLADAAPNDVTGVSLRIVQPNTAQSDKHDPDLIGENWRQLLRITLLPGLADATHVIWPESAPPFLLDESPEALEQIDVFLGPDRTLIGGAARRARAVSGEIRYYNSLFVIRNGVIGGIYDKSHLVPFGEYLPFNDTLESLGLTKLVGGRGSFTEGDGIVTMGLGDAPGFGPLICYEIVFPGEVAADTTRPGWLVNVTDDSWFGDTTGPWQHLAQARMRAIEEGLPVVRAANTGMSAIIDAHGRVRTRLAYGVEGVIDGTLPGALKPTLYVMFGDVVFFALLALLLAWGLWPASLADRAARGKRD